MGVPCPSGVEYMSRMGPSRVMVARVVASPLGILVHYYPTKQDDENYFAYFRPSRQENGLNMGE